MTTATTGAPKVTSEQADWFARAFGALVTNVEQAVLGKQHIVRLALTCLVSPGDQRTDVPAGMSSRKPVAAARSNSSLALTRQNG